MKLPGLLIATSTMVALTWLSSCSSDNNGIKNESELEPSPSEVQEEYEYIEDRLLKEFLPPNKARWYEYDERTVRVFGAGCTDAYCHHYIIHTDSTGRILECLYSNDYYCRDFMREDGTFTDLRTIKVFGCDSIELTEKRPYKITHIYDDEGNVIGYDSVEIEMFNARERFN